MESSVQEIIFEPIANMYGMSAADSERRLKLVSAGREDVDVRCLGGGRPFAVEVADPSRELSAEELSSACAQISASGKVVVNELVPVTKQDLAELKKGEQSKCKTYEALCIKLTSDGDGDDAVPGECGARVTAADIARVNAYRNVGEAGGVEGVEGEGGAAPRVRLEQRTPLRVLHRRPLRARTRYIYEMHAQPVPEHPQLLVLRVRTSAGAYVKEFVHGELARTRPALSRGVLPARLDLLALDVTRVHLDWPAGR
ncbi:unnamed protein product [Diatraea saccharalis]|uniref:tRNA pseudouridine(55) synthase n=1 Tax=Diatraea saccharalis TaxID=40085 RepID=A0A9P0G2M1_9NEOP|nr:unnamed protein product [Diatraea saccharalis]